MCGAHRISFFFFHESMTVIPLVFVDLCSIRSYYEMKNQNAVKEISLSTHTGFEDRIRIINSNRNDSESAHIHKPIPK